MNWKKIFFFNTMITPKLVTLLYWVLLITVIIFAIGVIFSPSSGRFSHDIITVTSLLQGLIAFVMGAIFSRVFCELMIVTFKINDNLQFLRDRKDTKAQQ